MEPSSRVRALFDSLLALALLSGCASIPGAPSTASNGECKDPPTCSIRAWMEEEQRSAEARRSPYCFPRHRDPKCRDAELKYEELHARHSAYWSALCRSMTASQAAMSKVRPLVGQPDYEDATNCGGNIPVPFPCVAWTWRWTSPVLSDGGMFLLVFGPGAGTKTDWVARQCVYCVGSSCQGT